MRPITDSRAEGLSISQLSRLSGVNIETIRFCERAKMLPSPPRTPGGHRVYDSTHLRTLGFIRRARELGFSLEEIRMLIWLGGPERATCREVRQIAARHLEDIRAKLNDLNKLERLLAKTLAQCSGRSVPDCPVIDILDIQHVQTANV
jgi:MerR family mercuric resistance operon transcriptional regulator